MSYSSSIGWLGFNKQSAKGTKATTGFKWIGYTQIDMQPEDLAGVAAPVIGGKAFPEDGYKAGHRASGGFAHEVRPTAVGNLLYYLSGNAAVSNDDPEVGAETHTFTMAAGDDFSLPWVTFIRSAGGVIKDEFVDCKIGGLRLVFAAGAPITAQWSVIGCTTAPFTGSEGTVVLDAGPLLVTPIAAALAQIDYDEDATLEDVITTSVMIDFGNMLTNNEFVIANPGLHDVTLLGRNIGVTWTGLIQDDDLWNAMHYGSPTGTEWSADPLLAKLRVKAVSGQMIGVTDTPYSLQFDCGEAMWTVTRVPLAARSLIAFTATAIVTVPAAGEEFTFTLVNAQAAEYDA
jgi:hypothetical protein